MVNLPTKFANVEKLNPGQNAKVYRALQVLLNRSVFLKIYPLDPSDPMSALKEPHLLTSLDHPNLVKIYSADQYDGNNILLEMEFIPTSLQDAVDAARISGNWPSIHQVLRFGADMAAGLGHLHGKSYVHRDCKPANVLVRRNSRSAVAVIADLGLAAKVQDRGRAFASKHARLYRPPEIWCGLGHSFSSDVYQVGMILFQLFGGSIRYELSKLSDVALAEAIRSRQIFDFSTLCPHVGRPVIDLIEHCICEEDNRIPDMGALAVACQNVRSKFPDWSLEKNGLGSRLERTIGDRILRCDVDQDKSAFIVRRTKRIGDGKWRQAAPLARISLKKNLRTCREFQSILNNNW